jgi:hypothetical protein
MAEVREEEATATGAATVTAPVGVKRMRAKRVYR